MSDKFSLLDLSALSKPATKLIECISGGLGAVTRPVLTRRQADADAYQIVVKAEAEAQAASIQQRIANRLYYQELRRQENLESVTEVALGALPEEVSDEPVSEDWLAFFLSSAKDVGDQEIQLLWAKVLAGEVASPGSFSLRTLESLRVLSRDDARLFQIGASYSAVLLGRPVIFTRGRMSDWLQENSMSPFERDLLESAGLIKEGLICKLDPETTYNVTFGNVLIEIVPKENVLLDFHHFTPVGIELLSLVSEDRDEDCKAVLLQEFESLPAEVTISEAHDEEG